MVPLERKLLRTLKAYKVIQCNEEKKTNLDVCIFIYDRLAPMEMNLVPMQFPLEDIVLSTTLI